ncbi:hypothetical protein PG999_001535 [Apiospora kogelbergensis]|uniref:Rhodopsin domain-containing protein n=1 Tax=Apiospora kogelbergensis TaxID=1337665 RepID=A0AAW0R5V7_9PEZI
MSNADGVATALPAAPGGYIVDHDHTSSQAHVVTYWVAPVGNVLALVLLAQRLYTKTALLKEFKLEDACLMLAWIISVGTQTVLVYMFATGVLGVHSWEISASQYSFYNIMILVVPVVYTSGAGLAKLSLLVYYHRLSSQSWFRGAVAATMVVVIGYSLGTSFSLTFGCNPIARSWDVTITDGACIDRDALHFITAILNIVTNLVIFALPIPMVIGWKMPCLQKTGLLVMFIIGGLTVASSAMRLVVLLPAMPDKDQTWAMAYSFMWICVEANLLIICATLPTLRRFLGHVVPSILGDYGYDDDDYDGDRDRLSPRPRAGRAKGGKWRRRCYNRFHDGPEYPMRSLHDMDLRPDEIQTLETRAGTNSRCSRMWDARPVKSDGDSEKAIFQTRTMTITYQTRDGDGSSRAE